MLAPSRFTTRTPAASYDDVCTTSASRSPTWNAFAERFGRPITSECLGHIVPLGEAHLRKLVREDLEHDNTERNHQGIGNVIPFPTSSAAKPHDAPVVRRKRLGGLLS